MNFHLLALPHAQTTREYCLDGFAQVTIRMARLLKDLGHTVYLYASEENDAPCDELITVISKQEIDVTLGMTVNGDGLPDATPYQYAYIDESSPLYRIANARTKIEIAKRKQPGDFILTIGGGSQKSVADAHPDLACVEYSIGYQGSFSDYRVFESNAWRHWTYGHYNIDDGRFTDAVIPIPFDPEEFPFSAEKERFVLYVGRLIERKGIAIAGKAADMAGVPLKLIGHGNQAFVPEGAEYLGALPTEERNLWMARAQAVITPTIYVEPFNQVAVEAQFCGTPVIATDWGGFTETIEHGVTGFCCNTPEEFAGVIEQCRYLDHGGIRFRAMSLYSMDTVSKQYQAYFERISGLRTPQTDVQREVLVEV